MGGTNESSGYNRPLRIKPELSKVGEDSSEGSRVPNQGCNVLHDDVEWSCCAYDSLELGPHPSLICHSQPLSRLRERLAREPAVHHVHALHIRLDHLPHVRYAPNVGPVLREHLPAELVDLHLQDRLDARSLKTEVESAYTAEQRHGLHFALDARAATASASNSIHDR